MALTTTSAGIPVSTYRLQLNRGFTVQNAIELVPYLSRLGIGAIYVSPILTARPGSEHGYDVVDHGSLNPELGSPEDFRDLGEALKKAGMGMIVDIVPNHMCITDSLNWRWMDVLENGPSSPQAGFFDIDWRPVRTELTDKVLLPVLGDQYGRVLENGDLKLEYSEGAFLVRYHDKTFPVAPGTWRRILEPVRNALRNRYGNSAGFITELESIITAISYLPLRNEIAADRIRERQREKEVIKSRLSRLIGESPEIRQAVLERIDRMSGIQGDPASFDELEQLLAEQAYRLSFWRVAAEEINYRRFFDINDLAAIRVEDPIVFDAVHGRIFDGMREGWITGLRIDHPDGLYDPAGYFAHLQQAALTAPANQPGAGPAPEAGFYVVAEKIMAADELPREDWAVHGTTGYGFLNEVNGLFVDPRAKETLNETYARFTRRLLPASDLVYECKRLVLMTSMSSELNVLARRLDRICQQHRHSRDFTFESLRFALREVLACFPVYRTYVLAKQNEVAGEDRTHVCRAIAEAKRRNPATSASIFDVIASILLLEDPEGLSTAQKAERHLFVMRFQQLTGPVMAKGLEDTAFYRQYPLASLNEVGGDPDLFGLDVKTFHLKVAQRSVYWPCSLLATTTHDTKRSEDVRARLNVLSEIPEEWSAALERWSKQNARFKTAMAGGHAPDRAGEYLLYQTLVGTWPLDGLSDSGEHGNFVLRMQEYMEKAMHEAKLHTSWINPNAAYDRAVRDFVSDVLRADNEFRKDIEEFAQGISGAGLWNSLSQTILKFTCPGVPDVYQGTELWSFTLVDPDNRQPVDYAHRVRLLAELPLESSGGRDVWLADAALKLPDGRLKLFVTACLGRFRQTDPDFFQNAGYIPLEATGPRGDQVISFARAYRDKVLIVAAGRLFLKLSCRTKVPAGPDVWQDSNLQLPHELPEGTYRDLLSGVLVHTSRHDGQTTLPVSQAFATLPMALLVNDNA